MGPLANALNTWYRADCACRSRPRQTDNLSAWVSSERATDSRSAMLRRGFRKTNDHQADKSSRGGGHRGGGGERMSPDIVLDFVHRRFRLPLDLVGE